jgi:hypothetical protein
MKSKLPAYVIVDPNNKGVMVVNDWETAKDFCNPHSGLAVKLFADWKGPNKRTIIDQMNAR